MDVLQLTATQFIRPMSTGRNRPVLLGCEDSAANPFEVVVKFRGKEMNAMAQIAELVTAQLADDLGLQVPQAGASRRYHHARPSALINTPLQWGAWPRHRDFFNRFNGLPAFQEWWYIQDATSAGRCGGRTGRIRRHHCREGFGGDGKKQSGLEF